MALKGGEDSPGVSAAPSGALKGSMFVSANISELCGLGSARLCVTPRSPLCVCLPQWQGGWAACGLRCHLWGHFLSVCGRGR